MKAEILKSVISASRRTDIPAFYMDGFMAGITRGRFEVMNPYNRSIRLVPASPDDVHTVVFWSKNFAAFIDGRYGERLEAMGYHLFFNFTLNSACPDLEPHLPPMAERLAQLAHLCDHFDARSVNWRFDPICFYRMNAGEIRDNLADFVQIADAAAALGIQRCISSFMDMYPKVIRRAQQRSGISFVDIPTHEKADIVARLFRILCERKIALQLCCEKEVLEILSPEIQVEPSACIPNELIMKLHGGRLSLRQASGQRVKAGCRCRESIDIGSYERHPCYHDCLFCYANPISDTGKRAAMKHSVPRQP